MSIDNQNGVLGENAHGTAARECVAKEENRYRISVPRTLKIPKYGIVRSFLVVCLTVIFISGCMKAVTQVEVADAIQVTDQSNVKPIAITKVAAKIRRGTVLGTLGIGALCIPGSDIKWRAGSRIYVTSEELVDVFREELETNGWPVVGSTEDLFSGYDVSGAEVLVAALITDVDSNLCAPNSGFGNWDAYGSMKIGVEWQVYSPAKRTLIGTVNTKGSANIESTSDEASYELMAQSFSVAVNNLLASSEFSDMVSRSSGLAQTPDVGEGTLLDNKINKYRTVESALEAAKRATVTIRTAQGHGSGFAIGDGSYVLTNRHVVGEAKNITLVTKDGLSIEGAIHHVSEERDIAVIRIDAVKLPSLHINTSVPDSGAKVYAVGSPLKEELSASITSGIISGTRLIDGYEYIQSDVTISPGSSGGPLLDKNGSVVGISSSGFTGSRGEQLGLNLFIPMESALAFAGLRVQ